MMHARHRLSCGWLCAGALVLLLSAVSGNARAQAAPPAGRIEEELHLALQGADTAKIRELIDAGARVNARDVLGGNALHVAANFRGDVEVLKLLLDKSADINAFNHDGATPLLQALRHGHYKHEGKGERLFAVAALLLSRGASLNGTPGPLPLRAAMDPVNLPLIRLLLQHGAALPDDGLDWALSNEYEELARLLMERATPAMLAFRDHSGGTLLHRAAGKASMRFALEWLVGKGFDVNALDNDRITPFGRAALFGNLPGMAYLLGAKARTDMLTPDGQTALHLAALGARHDVMRWLTERGLDIRARDKRGRTPLDIAVDTHRFAFYDEARKLELIALLGGVPADVVRGRYTKHPLHEAVNLRDFSAVERLLESGVSPNLKDASGNTPLYWAIVWAGGVLSTPKERDFGVKLLPLLLRHGADTTITKGDSVDETYDQFARNLRVGDMLERAKQRYAPRHK